MVTHIFNHSTQEVKVGKPEFEDWSTQEFSDPASINMALPSSNSMVTQTALVQLNGS